MASAAELFVQVGADVGAAVSGLNTLDNHVGNLDSHMKGLSGGSGGMGLTIGKLAGLATGIGAVVGIGGGLIDIFKDGVEQSNQWNAAMAQTDAVIKSTGGAAGVTKTQVQDLANSLSANGGLSTFADDAVASGENLLLTFTNIGKDVFPQATQAMLDLSAGMGQDMKSSAVQLGKALNDPVKGVTALQRVGVTFTEQQKEQIKAMVAAGDTAGAQKLILAELGKEFGGSALAGTKSFAGQQAILAEQFNNVKQTIGDALMPILGQLMGWVSGFLSGAGAQLPGILASIGNGFNQVVAFISPVVGFFQQFAATLQAGESPIMAFTDLLSNLGGFLGNLGSQVMNAIGAALPGIISQLGQWAQAFIAWIGPQIPGMLAELGNFLGSILGWIFGTALPNLIDNLGTWAKAFIDWIGPQLPGMLANLGVFLKNVVEWIFGTALPALISNLLTWGKAFIDWIGPRIGPMLVELGKILLEIGKWIVTVALPAIINQLIEWGKAFVGWIGSEVLPKLPGALKTILDKIGDWVKGALSWVGTKLREVGTAIVEGIKKGISNAWDAFVNWVIGLMGSVVDAIKKFLGISSPSTVFAEMGKNMALGMAAGITQGMGAVSAAWGGLSGGTVGMGGSVTVNHAGGGPVAAGGGLGSPAIYLDGQLVSAGLYTRQRSTAPIPGVVYVG